jgi:hypothetical protein
MAGAGQRGFCLLLFFIFLKSLAPIFPLFPSCVSHCPLPREWNTHTHPTRLPHTHANTQVLSLSFERESNRSCMDDDDEDNTHIQSILFVFSLTRRMMM